MKFVTAQLMLVILLLGASFAAPGERVGLQRLRHNTDAATVRAVTALPDPAAVLDRVAHWSNHGRCSVQRACTALAHVVATRGLGAGPLAVMLAALGPDDGQSVVVALANNLRRDVPQGLSRAQDALAVAAERSLPTPVNQEIVEQLQGPIPSMAAFHVLREMSPLALDEPQRVALHAMREHLPFPTPGTTMQKIVSMTVLEDFLSGRLPPLASGFQATFDDVHIFVTPTEIVEGLRLDYPGGMLGARQLGALLWKLPADAPLVIPYDRINGGPEPDDYYPNTGNGFTATRRPLAIPEWILTHPIPLPEGSQLERIDADGTRHPQATLHAGRWVRAFVEAGTAQ